MPIPTLLPGMGRQIRGIRAVSQITPSAEQRRIIDAGLRTIRIRAGAGTGKTTTVAMVIANLMANHGVDPEQILGITFTNKAAAELADRIRVETGDIVDEGRQPEVHTYHGFAAQILAEFGALAGVDTRVRIITPTFSRQVLSEIVHNTAYSHLDITHPRAVDNTRTLADRLADHLGSAEDLLRDDTLRDDVGLARAEMLETLVRYQEVKGELGVVDYGDLVTKSASVMERHPELAAQIRGRYRVVVLDEYQDTNPAQRILLTSVFNAGFPVIAVGDEDQTIYEWRGASPENFSLFTTHFPGTEDAPALDLGLTANRRSAQQILDIANVVRARANRVAENLVAVDPSRQGETTVHWAQDSLAEADWITEQFSRLHADGIPWRDMAVLIRKNKDFPVMVEAMRTADIPVEVANLGGLLVVPEVAELRAWLTILGRPGDSAATIQILFGSGYRLGLADIAPIARWAGSRITPYREDVPAVSLLEGLEHLDEIEGVRAREELEHFRDVYRQLLIESQGASLVETCRMILDRTRAWPNAEALPATRRLTARLNLYRMLDLAEDWSPLSGRPSLTAFLEYLDAMEEEPAEELDAARLSGEDAVTLVTVHRAKGLEWEVVALPTLTKGNFPSGATSGFPDPTRFPHHLPAEHRIDSALAGLPSDEKGRKEFFREANQRQEWRVAYVAATRAKSRLYATGAHWYGRPEPNKTPKVPSELFELIAGQPAVVDAGRAALGPRPDLLRRELEAAAPDPLFERGWAAAIRAAAAGHATMRELAAERGLIEEMDEEVDNLRQALFALDEYTEAGKPEDRSTSVTGLVTYARCPKQYYWTNVDPLPRRPNPAAVAGTELHRRIELYQKGQVPFEEVNPDLYDAADDQPGKGAWTAFRESRFAATDAALVEAPFVLELENGYRIRGRIDAIYADDGAWEIVDFKSGSPKADDSRIVQLEAYAVAAQDAALGIAAPASTTVTFAYLGDGLNVETHTADEPWIAKARAHLLTITDDIDGAKFPERPGEQCRRCDFLRFCAPGRAWMETQ